MTGTRPEALPRFSRRGLRALAAGVAAATILAGALAAAGTRPLHTELKESDPAADTVLEASPDAVTLTYTTDVQLAVSTVAVRAAGVDGAAAAAGDLAYLADDRHDVLVLPLSEPLGPGGHVVAWTTAGPDGHRLSGDFEFRVEPPEDGTRAESPEAAPASAESSEEAVGAGPAANEVNDQPVAGDSGPRLALGSTFVRFAFYLGILSLLGAAAFQLLVLGGLRRAGESREVVDHATRRTALVARVGLGILLGVLPLRLIHQAVAFFPDDPLGNLLAVAAGSPWAAGWWLQLAAALLVAVGLVVAGRDGARAAEWNIVAAGALLVAFVPVLSGHGWADGPRALSAVATHLHVVAAGSWVGGLLCLLLAGLPALREHGSADAARGPGLAGMVGAFSRVAQVAVALLLTTGAVKVWIHVGALSDLWTTAWGRSLLVKDLAVAGVLALGFYNWRFVRPALERSPRLGPIRSPAMVELLFGVVAVAVTAFLVAQPLE